MAQAEQAQEVKPLHGDWIHGLRIVPLDGRWTLIRRRYAMELGVTERVNAITHPNHPGIRMADIYSAPVSDVSEPPSLEEALENDNGYSYKFLLSMATSGLAVVTSRFWYRETKNVRILPPSEYVKAYGQRRHLDLDVRMRDYDNRVSEDELTKRHIGRVARAGGDVSVEMLPPEEMDEVFRHIVQDRTKEVNSFDYKATRAEHAAAIEA